MGSGSSRAVRVAMVVIAVVGAAVVPAAAVGASRQAGGNDLAANTVAAPYYFPQTGHYLSGRFREFWESRGGLFVFGYPLTTVYTGPSSDGSPYLLQYFERAVFEYHPGNPPPYDVLLTLVGNEVVTARRNEPPFQPAARKGDPNGGYAEPTRHNLGGAFLRYWDKFGGLQSFGYPISEEFVEQNSADGKSYTVQYFERARFEYHPEYQGTDYEVLLGLMGLERAKRVGVPDRPRAAETSPPGPALIPGSRASIPNTPLPPAPLPMISRGLPASSNDDCGGSYPAGRANDANYGTYWQAACSSTGGALATPVWLAYDLSGVPATRRGKVLLTWSNDPMTGPYEHGPGPGYNIPAAYTIEANPAPGGTTPTSGWVSLLRVSGNTYHSRQHLIDLTGYTWVRLKVTASDGSSQNFGVALNMDLHDASQGVQDDWIFFGSSTTMSAMSHSPFTANGGTGTFSQLINAKAPTYFPVQENGGIGGLTADQGAASLPGWLKLFPGQFVALSYGLNDANNAAAGAVDATAFYNNYATMVEAILAAGKTPLVSKVPWARTANVQANAPLLNAKLEDLYAAYPQVIPGPDFWTYFGNNQSLISSDDLHPTPEGMVAYRQQWVNQLLPTVYKVGAASSPSPAR